ncbi:MAG TPA: 50S ribosomal protein L19 [Candidatus Woesebacteria bacterium]|nr:50S ribosomal protein L19 [Candidatus Woesebacteria bacterium]
MSISFTFQDHQFSVGDTLKINYKIKEKDKERTQAFDGILLAIKGAGENKAILIRKAASDSVKVERIFPLNSPWIESIQKMRAPKSKIRRSKLYFLREAKTGTI